MRRVVSITLLTGALVAGSLAAAYGQAMDGQGANDQAAYGQGPNDEAADGQATSNQSANDRETDDQPTNDDAEDGVATNTATDGQAAYGQSTDGDAAYVERSSDTFHVRACPDVVEPGVARCHAHIVTDDTGFWLVHDAQPDFVPSGYGPADLRAAYNIPAGGGASTTIVAIVDAYGYAKAESDLAVYRSTFGLPPCTSANGCFKKVNQNGAAGHYPRQDMGWADESALDLDMASAMCPKCTLVLVEADTASLTDLAAAVNTAARLGAHVISNSYGGG